MILHAQQSSSTKKDGIKSGVFVLDRHTYWPNSMIQYEFDVDCSCNGVKKIYSHLTHIKKEIYPELLVLQI